MSESAYDEDSIREFLAAAEVEDEDLESVLHDTLRGLRGEK